MTSFVKAKEVTDEKVLVDVLLLLWDPPKGTGSRS